MRRQLAKLEGVYLHLGHDYEIGEASEGFTEW